MLHFKYLIHIKLIFYTLFLNKALSIVHVMCFILWPSETVIIHFDT